MSCSAAEGCRCLEPYASSVDRLSSVMRYFRRSIVRALLGMSLAIGLAFSAGEAGIADVHDGDAAHSEVDRASGITHADHAGTLDPSEVPEPDTAPAHSFHVCHCAHIHVAVVAVRTSPVILPLMTTVAFPDDATAVADGHLYRWTPPPIAASA